jgi:hypothetical protein
MVEEFHFLLRLPGLGTSALKLVFFLCVSSLGLLPLSARAQDNNAAQFGTFTFYAENDAFARTDSNYTGGAKFTSTRPFFRDEQDDALQSQWYYPLVSHLPFVKKPEFQLARSLSLGLTIFTPEDIKRRDLIEDDRPYAGFLYFAFGLHARSSDRTHTLEIDTGIVGPHSYVEQVQKGVHRLIGSNRPRGWDNQLEDEFALEVIYESKWKLLHSDVGSGFAYDFIPHVGGRIGNVHIYANGGAEFRFGWYLPNDFGTCPIRPGCESHHIFDRLDNDVSQAGRFGVHTFIALDGKAVARDIFLDGNTFRDSHEVDKNVFVADIMAGIGLTSGRFKLTYAYVYRTKEFKKQDNDQRFASLTLGYTF